MSERDLKITLGGRYRNEYQICDERGCWTSGYDGGKPVVFLRSEGGKKYTLAGVKAKPFFDVINSADANKIAQFWAGEIIFCVRHNPSAADGWGALEIYGDLHQDLKAFNLFRTPIPDKRMVDGEDVTDLVVDFAKKQRAKKQQAEVDATKTRNAIFALAKESGEPVLIEHWMSSCDEIDCSCDHCTSYAMPDGTTKIERIHCY